MSYNGTPCRQPPNPSGWMAAAKVRNKAAGERAKTPLRTVALPPGTSFDGPKVERRGYTPSAAGGAAPAVVAPRPGTVAATRAISPPPRPGNASTSSGAPHSESPGARQRIQSFHSIVALATAHNGNELYSFKVMGIERRKVALESDSTVAMYQISMSQSGQTWTIYRRYKQFRELDANLKKKQLLALTDKTFPSKGSYDNPKPEDEDARMAELQVYLEGLMSIEAIAVSHYLGTFFEPINMGDTKRV